MIYYIYKHTNRINGKIYIGQTCNLNQRWQPNSYKGCTHFYNAILQYGWDNFNHEVLETIDTEQIELVNKLEDKWINFYQSRDENIGYNLRAAGSNGQLSLETRQKMSDAHKGLPGYWTGKQFSEEHKEKLKDAHARFKSPIICVTTSEWFDGTADAVAKYGINAGNLSQHLRGLRKSCGKHPETNEKLVWRNPTGNELKENRILD